MLGSRNPSNTEQIEEQNIWFINLWGDALRRNPNLNFEQVKTQIPFKYDESMKNPQNTCVIYI